MIIGSGSLVNLDIPDNCVAAGNPCRVIMGLEDYYKKRVSLQYEEAKDMVKNIENDTEKKSMIIHCDNIFGSFKVKIQSYMMNGSV